MSTHLPCPVCNTPFDASDLITQLGLDDNRYHQAGYRCNECGIMFNESIGWEASEAQLRKEFTTSWNALPRPLLRKCQTCDHSQQSEDDFGFWTCGRTPVKHGTLARDGLAYVVGEYYGDDAKLMVTPEFGCVWWEQRKN